MTSQAAQITPGAASAYEALVALDPAVLESIPAAVYVCAADGRIVRFNRRAAELWGRTPEIGDTDERFCGSSGCIIWTGGSCRTPAHRWRSRFGPANRNATWR
jgi:PAS domain-containing protein